MAIKGKTKIILTDVNTGEQEIHEDTNMVTNAIKYIMGISTMCNYRPNERLLPLASNMLGGLMLFDGDLTEDADNVHFPTEAHLVGYAGRETNTSDKMAGSFNSAESGRTSTGYTSVWDFGTSQANGSIKSAALTHYLSGARPIGYVNEGWVRKSLSIKSTENSGWYPIYDDGDYLYLIKFDTTTHNAEIRKEYHPTWKLKVSDYLDASYDTAESVTSFDTEVYHETINNGYDQSKESEAQYYEEDTIYIYADSINNYFDGGDGYIYCIQGTCRNKSASHISRLAYFTLNYGDGSWKKSDTTFITVNFSYEVNINSGNVHFDRYKDGYYPDYYSVNNNRYLTVRNGILFLRQYGGKGIGIIPLTEPLKQNLYTIFSSDSSDIVNDIYTSGMLYNGVVIWSTTRYNDNGGSYHSALLIYPDGTFIIEDRTNAITGDHLNTYYSNERLAYSKRLGCFINNRYYSAVELGAELDYLGTINNLSSAITKTASQTMKVIYTLTDVDESTSSSSSGDTTSTETA